MDLKKYFTDEEIKNLCGLQQLSIADYASKEKLNDGLGVRDYNTENHWRACDENFSLLDKKTILILPGSGTNSKKQANGMCKIAEDMLPDDQKDKWQICSMHYEDSRIFHIPTVIRATELLDNYFAPLFSTQDKEGNLHKIDAKKAAENMRNIIIFTHCYGGYIEKEIERKMSELMLDIGYTDKERDDIMKQMFVVQHNNIDEKLGQNKMFATHLLRLSAADEETDVSDMLYGSFRHYAISHKIDDNSVAYLKVSDNERVLWVNRITKDKMNEHNGGYWVKENHKNEAGLKEDLIFKLIFHEVTSSDYLIENMERILRYAAEKNPDNKKVITECLKSGKDFSRGFSQYQDKFINDFTQLKNKVDNKFLTRADILQADKDVCFVEDNNGKFLMDYLLEDKNYNLATVLMKKMAPAIPTMDKWGSYKSLDSKNKKDAAENIHDWAQTALNDNQLDILKQLIENDRKAYQLDYTQANSKTLLEIIPLVFSKENYNKCQDSCSKDKYIDNMLAVYAAMEKAPKTEETSQIQQYIEKLLFKEDLSINGNTIIRTTEELEIPKLHRMAKNKWDSPKNMDDLIDGNYFFR